MMIMIIVNIYYYQELFYKYASDCSIKQKYDGIFLHYNKNKLFRFCIKSHIKHITPFLKEY